MPFLVVLGTGSWSAPAVSRTTYKAAVCKASGEPYKVDAAVAEAARATGYWWLQVFDDDDEPVLDVSDPSGPLEPDDIRVGVQGGVRLHLEEAPEPEEVNFEYEGSPLVHGCKWCPRRFPSSAAHDRHIEFEHTRRHEKAVAESVEEYKERMARKAELERLQTHEEALPPWEREAVEVTKPGAS